MTYKMLAIAAMSLSLGATTALASQSGTTGMSGMQSDGTPSDWEGAIADAFYSDTERGTLRSTEEMRNNWEDLSDEDKGVARDHCASIAMDADRATMGSGAITESGTTAGVDTSTRTGGTAETTGSTTGSSAITESGTTAGVDTSTRTGGTSGTTGSTTGASAITESGTTAGVDTSTRTGSASGTTGTSADASADMHHASLQQICEIVD